MLEPIIILKNISKSFSGKPVLQNLSMEIKQGQITTIIGKSGCGKSVLLKHIIGLMQADSGHIYFNGQDLLSMTKSESMDFKNKFSYMFQDNALFDSLTIFENIALPLSYKKSFITKVISEKVLSIMTKLEIKDTIDKFPAELSGGMKKRVALARALITEPEIILFDEPTTGLDPIRKENVHRMIHDYKDFYGYTGVIVSHEIPDIFDISQTIIMIDEGKAIFQGTQAEIEASKINKVKLFIKGHK
ncbi:MAG: ATP-binding cassette domain-containing protein [Desulfotalea sp.]